MIWSIYEDTRCAIRAWRARPVLFLAALLTLALGIGANVAIFTVFHAVLIRRLPYADSDRIVRIYESYRGNRNRAVANPFNFETWRRMRTFERISAVRTQQVTLTGGDGADRVWMSRVDGDFFRVFGVSAALGRTLNRTDEGENSPVVVLSHSFWMRKLGGDPDVLSRTLLLDGSPVSIVGVMPPDFRFPERTVLYRPLRLSASARANMSSWYLEVVGKLSPDASLEQAQSELDVGSAELARRYPAQREGRGAWVVGLREDLGYRSAPVLRLLQAVVALVLLVACANVANLLLAAAPGRAREFGIRSALGASRWRLIRQMATESLLLSVAGGAVGLLVAWWALPGLVFSTPALTLPEGIPISLNLPVLLFALAAATATGLAACLAPVAFFTSPRLSVILKHEGRTSAGVGSPRHRRIQSALVAAEVAISLTLIVASSLLIASFVRVASQDRGFIADRLLTTTITLPGQRYPSAGAQQRFWTDLIGRLRTLPGVTAVGASSAMPFSNWEEQSWFEVRGRENAGTTEVSVRTVTPDYFTTLGIPMRSGRVFTTADAIRGEPVVVVNDAFVRQHLAGLEPVGALVRTEREAEPGNSDTDRASQSPISHWATVVGVVGSTRHVRLEESPRPELYRPLAQVGASMMVIAVRSGADPHSLTQAIRTQVRQLDADLPLEQIQTMDEAIGRTTAARRFQTSLITLFGILACALAVIGTYSVTSHHVELRRTEVDIRMALGATAGSVKRLMWRQGLRPVIAGALIGVLGATGISRLLRAQLFHIEVWDLFVIAAVAIAFVGVGALACWVPARRVSHGRGTNWSTE